MASGRKHRTIRWAGASLAALAATPAAAQDATWSTTPENVIFGGRSDYQDPDNWVQGAVPTGTATFGPTGESDIFFDNQVDQQPIEIGRFVFTADAPAYIFTLQSDEFTFTGDGIVNNSANAQTLISGNRSILRFANASSAGNAALRVEGGTGRLFFQDDSSAASSTITVGNQGSAGIVAFSGNATAASATIDNVLGNVNFIGSSTAGDATITNSSGVVFGDSSSLGTAQITGLAGGIRVFGAANGPNATIVNQAGSTLDVSQLDGGPQDLAIGSLSGAGSVLLGGRNLVLGNLGLDDILSGTIADGGDLGGTGGSLTKIGAGTLTLTGASTYTGDTSVTGGTLTLTGSIDGTDEVIVGRVGTGTLIVEGGGSLASSGAASIGAFGGTGTVLVTGAGSDWTTDGGISIGLPPLLVDTAGAGGTGRLNIENGASVTSVGATILQNSFAGIDGKATVTGAGSVWNTGALGISSSQRLELLTITAGATVNSTTSTIAGGVRVAGAGSTWNSGALALGPNLNANGTPPGLLTIADGGVVNSSSALVDDGGGIPSAVTVDGAGSAWNVTGDLRVALSAFDGGSIAIRNGGTINVDGGAGDVLLGTTGGTAFLTIGGGAPGTTPGNLEAASVELGANSILAFEYTGQSHVFAPVIGGAGRVFAGSGTTILTGDSAAYGGTTTVFDGATLQIGTFAVSGGPIGIGNGGETGALGGDIVNNGQLILARSGPLAVNGIISGSGSLTHTGPAQARTTLSATSTYTGATTVNGGTLLVNGSIAASAVRVNGGGTLGGTGTVGSTEAFGGGTLAPGTSIGTLNVAGNLTLDNANYLAEVAPAAADRIAVTGNALLDGRLVAIATGGSYTPGQYTLLTTNGRAGAFDILALEGNFGGLAASLSYVGSSVVLDLSEFTGGSEDRWLADPATNDWNTGTNWDPAAVPSGTARFGPSTKTTVDFSRGTTQIGRILLDADAPAYTFRLDSGRRSEGGGDSLSFLGEGIVNNSAHRPAFQAVSIDTVAGGGGAISFFNASSAGNASILSFNSGNVVSSTTTFYQTSSAGTAILDNVGQGVAFRDSSSAASATINNGSDGGLAGATAFFDDSSAGSAIINNPIDLGGVVFFDSSTAGLAQILNRSPVAFSFGREEFVVAGVQFNNQSDAGSARIDNDGGSTAFVGTSSAADATIVNSNANAFAFSTLFAESSSAGSATITNNQGGATVFQAQASAGSATIVNNEGGTTEFFRTTANVPLGSPTVTNNDGGVTRFRLLASGESVTVVNHAGGLVDISEDPEQTPALVAPSVAIGSLSGDGDVALGARTLILGGLNRDDTIGGTIRDDGGQFDGIGGALTKAGTGTLTLTGDNAFTGATRIEAGTLQLGDGGGTGSIAGAVVNDASLVIDRTGALTLGGIISGTGTLTQNGSATTILAATNSYTGATTVNGGTLLVTGSIASSSQLAIQAGATLGGTGTVGDTSIADGGAIAPGLSIGTLSIAGNLALGNAGYLAEVSPTAADLIDVAGSASLDGILTAIATGGAYAPGEFILLTAGGGRTGTFDSLVTQGSFGGLSAVLSYDANNVILTLAAATGDPDWTGTVSTDWFVNGNWDNNAVPTAGVAVTINTDTPNPTVIAAAGAESGNITIGGVSGQTGDLTIQGGGTLATGGQAIVGTDGGVGEVLVTGAGSRWTIAGALLLAAPSEGVGTFGTLRIEGGATVTSSSTQLNQLANRSSRAVASGSGTTWNTGNFNANGLANLTGDMVTVEAGATVVSTQSALASRMTVTGAGTSWTSGALLVGSSSGINPGRLAILDGATVTSSTAQLGFSPVGAGSGSASRGFVEVSAATWNIGADLLIGPNAFNVGTLLLRDGGTATIAAGSGEVVVGPNSALTIGGAGTAAPGLLDAVAVDLDPEALLTFSHNGGDHVFAPTINGGGDIAVTLGTTILTADNSGFTGTTTIGAVIPQVGRGGVLQLGNGGATGALGGDIVNDNELIVDRTGALMLAGIVSGTGTLIQHGDVTTTLSGASTYTGATTVNGGTLLVTGSIAGSAVTANDGATLGGIGTVGATTIADGGAIAPGTSIGTLSIAGNLVFGDGIYRAEVSPAAADLIDVSGSATLAGTLEAVATGGTYTAGQTYTLLTADGGVTGTFAALTMQGDFSGYVPTLRYNADSVLLSLNRAGPVNTATTTFTDALVFNSPTVTVERISLFETRIIGRLDGGAPLFDETYASAFDSPLVQQGVQSARLAVTAAGGPGVVVLVSDPVLVSRNVTSTTASTSLFSLAETRQSVTTTTTFGPATVTIGDAQSCGDAIAALPSGARPSCGAPGGQVFNVEPGTVNINTGTHSDYFIDEARTDTTTETVRETWELTGTVVPVGSVHAAVLSGLYDLSGRLLHRVAEQGAADPFGDGAPDVVAASRLAPAGGGGGWAEAYGFRNHADARAGLPAERRDAWGLAGGFTLAAGEGIMIGFGVDHGQLDLDVPEAGEEADIELTQLALGARLDSGRFSLALSASYGFGSVDSSRSLIALSTAAYDVDTLGLFAEASYVLEAGAWRIVPTLGIDHVRIETDDFTETGALGLSVPEQDSDRTRLFPGVEAGRSFALGGGRALDVSGSVKYLALLGGEQRALPVAFSIAPGTPLVMRGLPERDSALIGAQARLRLTPSLDLYLAYDGRFAGGYDAHGATVGLRFAW